MTIAAACDLSDRFSDDARVLPPLFRDFGKRKIFKGFDADGVIVLTKDQATQADL